MGKRSFKRFLISTNAIQIHLLCWILFFVLGLSFWTGEAKHDYVWGLLFTIVVYPVLLGLMWWYERQEEEAAIEHIVESVLQPEALLRKRVWWRRFSMFVLILAAAGLVYFGNRGLHLDFLPAQYLGYFLYALAALGILGVNIWRGGPLDLRQDPPQEYLERRSQNEKNQE